MTPGARTLLFAALAGLLAWWLGDGTARRQSNPDGYHLVTVKDQKFTAPRLLPERAVVVVADGLRADAALGMASVARLKRAGQCRPMDVGSPSTSRPVYVALSTGLEADRSGVRSNAERRPIKARSIWQVARDAHRRVEARSGNAYWRESFPEGFDDYAVRGPGEDLFAPVPTAALTLIHPLYVDDAGHAHGGTSPEYAEAVARLDRELGRLLDGLDLGRDLVVLVSDHGHTARGGHGGRQPEVAVVLACLAGRGVVARDSDSGMLALDVAPALAVLLGLPYPPNMRAGADDLDVIRRLVHVPTLGRDYLIDRQIGLSRFRAANPAWPRIYAEGRAVQAWKLGVVLALCVIILGLGGGWRTGLWAVATIGAAAIAHALRFGSVDLSAIAEHGRYVTDASVLWAAVALVAFAARWAWARDLRVTIRDLALLTAVGLVVLFGHVWVFGWPLGFPAPTPRFFFLPVFASIGTFWFAVALAGASLAELIRRRPT